MNELTAKIEALLFARGEAIQVDSLAKMLAASPEETKNALIALQQDYANNKRGVVLLYNEQEGAALATNPLFGELLQSIFSQEVSQELTPVALETLAIIAYRGPISRPEIDDLRGVNSTFMLRNLMIRGLVTRAPDPNRPHLWRYEITHDCLKMLGVSRREELPDFNSLSQDVAALQAHITKPIEADS